MIFVDSVRGKNRFWRGSEEKPYRTLTYALKRAKPGDVVMLLDSCRLVDGDEIVRVDGDQANKEKADG